MTELLVVLAGILAGVLSGLLGVGGGAIFVPVLVFLFSFGQVNAVATSLLAIVPVAVVGSARQWKYGNVRLKDGVVLGLLAVGGTAVGVVVANGISERTLRVAFALFLLVVAGQLIRHGIRSHGKHRG